MFIWSIAYGTMIIIIGVLHPKGSDPMDKFEKLDIYQNIINELRSFEKEMLKIKKGGN